LWLASEADWDVFTGFPIHHDQELAAVQQRCIAIAEREYVGGGGRLFSPRGCEEIAAILAELKAKQADMEREKPEADAEK